MTITDVQRIFKNSISGDIIILNENSAVTIDDFLNIAGFKNAPDNPTKQDLISIDAGIKNYSELIESGNYS